MILGTAAVVLVGLGWLVVRLHQAARQADAVRHVRERGGWVFYNCRYDESGLLTKTGPPGPAWLRGLLGADFFGRVDGVRLSEAKRLEGLVELELIGRPLAKLTNDDLAPLHVFADLQWLALHDTRIGDAGLEHLEGFARLERLWLDGTQVTDAGLKHLEGLRGLRYLSLRHTRVSDKGLAHLAGLRHLQTLNLDHTRCTLSGVVRLLTVEHNRPLADALEVAGYAKRDADGDVIALNLSRTRVTDSGLADLKGLSKLRWLIVNGTEVTDAGLVHLGDLTALELLHLADTQITDAGLEHLVGLKKLRTLHLTGTEISTLGIERLRIALPDTLRIYHASP
jgi:Leucine-rich repeat (LRR) protein